MIDFKRTWNIERSKGITRGENYLEDVQGKGTELVISKRTKNKDEEITHFVTEIYDLTEEQEMRGGGMIGYSLMCF